MGFGNAQQLGGDAQPFAGLNLQLSVDRNIDKPMFKKYICQCDLYKRSCSQNTSELYLKNTPLRVNTVIQILEMAAGLAYRYACSLSSRTREEGRGEE